MSNKYLRAMRNTITVSPDKTPFCGTCYKAGRSREEYTSHFTRKTKDTNSEVVCPLILNSTCSNCQKLGHWRKYCPDLFTKQKDEDQLFIEEYRSSEESLNRPNSPDFPPPWLEEKPIKKVMSWAEIVSAKNNQ